jgi:hypothetical protein
VGSACAVCAPNGESEASVQAFRIMTGVMSFFPLLAIGGVMYWIYRRYKAHEESSDALPARAIASADTPPPSR